MIQNKIVIDGIEYELEENNWWSNVATSPSVYFKEKRYIGKAIPKQDKDYEVLAYRGYFGIRSKREDGLFYFPSTANNQTSCNERELSGWEIYCVRRLSDNEIFTIGDEVMWNLPEQAKKPFTINSFEVNDMISHKRMFCNNNNIDICYLKKAKERIPLFMADNGETPIYEGDKAFYIWENYAVHNTGILSSASQNRGLGNYPYFSSEEKANEYVLMNKPILSLNDFNEWHKKYYHSSIASEAFLNGLTNLAKEKIEK